MTGSSAPAPAGLLLIDGSAFAYRAHMAMERQGLSRRDGLPTGAIFAFANELRRLVAERRPEAFAVVFDAPGPTFRDAMFAEYKAQRPPMPAELAAQWPWLKKVAAALGAHVLETPGVEADDVLGTLARRASAAGLTTVVVSPDKDLLQLVDERTSVLRPPRLLAGEWTLADVAKVRELWGVEPARVADVLALMGDAVDNAPGVPGIGEVTAKKLVARFGGLEDVLRDAPDASAPRAAAALREHAEQARLTLRLVTIKCDVEGLPSLSALAYSGPDRAAAEALFRDLEFKSLAEAYAPPRAATPRAYRLVASGEELERLVAEWRAADLAAVDTETTGLNPLRAALVCVSVSTREGEAWCVPLRADPPLVPDAPNAPFRGAAVLEKLRPFLEDPRPTKCGQNAKYDALVLRRHGVRLAGLLTDTMLASYLLEPGRREHNLDALALDRFGHRKIKTEELIGRGKDELTMDLVPLEHLAEYACEDADYTRRLAAAFLPELDAKGLRRLHDDVELPLLFILADMEEAGVRVDRALLKKLAAEWAAEAERLAEEIRVLAEDPGFNPGSTKQLGELLFERLKVHEAVGVRPKRTKTGYATGQEALEELGESPLVRKILEWRSTSKLVSTYVAPLPELAGEESRLHTSFNQAVAATGRLSSSDPNLQNIPIRTPRGRMIRKAFLPTDPDGVLISADYSQIELRLLAHFSEDPDLLAAFRAGRDIHRETAARVFGGRPEDVDAETRSRAKAVNFGVLYGMGPARLARETNLTLEEAKAFIERYFAAFPRIRNFLDGLKESARRLGYATTILGRRRPIPDLDSPNGMLRNQAENMAVNTPIQGSAADLIKLAMIAAARRLRDEGLKTRLVLQVHDELVFDAPAGEADAAAALARETMEGVVELKAPLRVDVGRGPSWYEAH
jgi:DNA polymerase-1